MSETRRLVLRRLSASATSALGGECRFSLGDDRWSARYGVHYDFSRNGPRGSLCRRTGRTARRVEGLGCRRTSSRFGEACVRCVVSSGSGLHVRNKRARRWETRQTDRWPRREIQPDERSASGSWPRLMFLVLVRHGCGQPEETQG